MNLDGEEWEVLSNMVSQHDVTNVKQLIVVLNNDFVNDFETKDFYIKRMNVLRDLFYKGFRINRSMGQHREARSSTLNKRMPLNYIVNFINMEYRTLS